MSTLDELRVAANAIAFEAGGRLRVGDTTLDPEDPAFAGGSIANTPALLLRTLLYEYFYSARFCGTLGPIGSAQALPAFEPMLEQLRAVNPTRARWESGWQLTAIDAQGRSQATKAGQLRSFETGQCLADVKLQSGVSVRAFCANEPASRMPGFYHVLGELVPQAEPGAPLSRVYFNVRCEAAEQLLATLCGALNEYQVPFLFKTLTVAPLYSRRDSAVLYVERRRWPIVSLVLDDILGRISGDLDPEVPLFSKQIAAGIGVAEDPMDGESFGQHRCRLLAEALWHAHCAGRAPGQAAFDSVASYLQAHGLRLEATHLNPGSRDPYAVLRPAPITSFSA
jgi:HopA1 effector protein family